MSSILSKTRTYESRNVMPIRTFITSKETGETDPPGFEAARFGCKKEYIIEAKLMCHFWATDAQREEAENLAMKVLNQELYHGSLGCIAKMRSAIMSGDNDYLLLILSELEREIGL